MLTEPLVAPRLEQRRKCREILENYCLILQHYTGKLLFNSSALCLTIWHLVDEGQEEADNETATVTALQAFSSPAAGAARALEGWLWPW